MKKTNTRRLVQTAILLALCVCFQLLKSISVYITGPLVNMVIILASLSCGWQSGIAIACLSPFAAWLIGATPIIHLVPAMLPVIMAGNCMIAVIPWLFRKHLIPGLLIGSAAKACFLWLTVWYAIFSLFGSAIPEKMTATVKMTFSLTQLITALIGSALAFAVWKTLKKYLAVAGEGSEA